MILSMVKNQPYHFALYVRTCNAAKTQSHDIETVRTCVIKMDIFKRNVAYCFLYHRGLLLKERIRSLREPILSFKRGPHFEKGRY